MFEREKEPVIDDTPINMQESSTDSDGPPIVPCTLERHASEPEEMSEEPEQEEESNQAIPDNQTLIRLLEDHEKVKNRIFCQLKMIAIHLQFSLTDQPHV